MSVPNDIVLFHYSFSPYARRIVWYLTLRNISYAECIQPPVLPRPDLAALGVHYRRIPLLSIGNTVFADTRLILRRLEALSPPGSNPPLLSKNASDAAITRLLDRLMSDSGVFPRCAALIPPDSPVFSDPKFLSDRTAMTGRKWSVEGQKRGRGEALVYVRDAVGVIETLLADGRPWILGGNEADGPSMADIEAVWPFDWVLGMPGAVPGDVINSTLFPKFFAWRERFNKTLQAAKKTAQKPLRVKGPQAYEAVTKAKPHTDLHVDEADPTGLKAGEVVALFPIDSGFGHQDVGPLVMLTADEIGVEVKAKGGEKVRVHAPRWGFRVQKANGQTKL